VISQNFNSNSLAQPLSGQMRTRNIKRRRLAEMIGIRQRHPTREHLRARSEAASTDCTFDRRSAEPVRPAARHLPKPGPFCRRLDPLFTDFARNGSFESVSPLKKNRNNFHTKYFTPLNKFRKTAISFECIEKIAITL
jgi:hypothetical protein